jgi:hypothetical protein
VVGPWRFSLVLSKQKTEDIRVMNNTNTTMKEEYIIKSVGFNIEDGGCILDDRNGLDEEFVEFFEDGKYEVTFEEGLKEILDYVKEYCDDENDVEKVKELLLELKKEVSDDVKWVVWGVEYDLSLGVKVSL